MINLIFTFLLSAFCLVHSNLEIHFKPISDKADLHFNQMENINFIYLINLDQRPEKLEHCLNELAPYNIHPYRFSAVNGWELSLDVINDVGIKYDSLMAEDLWGTSFLPEKNFEPQHEVMQTFGRCYYYHGMTLGAIGIVLSHLSVLQDAYDCGYETIWILEDDIEVIQNPHLLSDRISELDSLVGKINWDIIFTDQDTKNQQGNYVSCSNYAKRPNYMPENSEKFAERTDINSEFIKIGARYGAYSMIIRRSGIEKILDFLKRYHIFLPYDMEYYLPDTLKIYALTNDIVSTQPQAITDNSAPNYKKN